VLLGAEDLVLLAAVTTALVSLLRVELVGKSVCKLTIERGIVSILVLRLAEGAGLVLVEGLSEGLRVGEAERFGVVQVVNSRDRGSLLLLLIPVLVEVGNLNTEVVAVGIGNFDVVLVGSGREAETLTTTCVPLTTESKVVVLICVGRLGGSQVGILICVLVGIIDGIVVGVIWVVVLIPLVVILRVLAVLRLVNIAWLDLGFVVTVGVSIALARGGSHEGNEGGEEKSGLSELHFEGV